MFVFCNYYRLSKSNMFLGGIWCSAKKPPTVTVVEPTITELYALEMEGIYTQHAHIIYVHACSK